MVEHNIVENLKGEREREIYIYRNNDFSLLAGLFVEGICSLNVQTENISTG